MDAITFTPRQLDFAELPGADWQESQSSAAPEIRISCSTQPQVVPGTPAAQTSSSAAAATCASDELHKPLSEEAKLDQYYTKPEVAERFYGVFQEHFDPADYLMVEPTAGMGAFFNLLPSGSLGYDLDPRCTDIQRADFLSVEIKSERTVAIIGNPPFGKNASLAVAFFNHAARQSSVVAFIMPRSIRKVSMRNRLHSAFHLVREEAVPDHAFLFRGTPFHVPTVFQIWERRPYCREREQVETSHPDFVFTTPQDGDFAIQRVGANAGRVHHDFGRSPSSHYFIKGDVEAIMRHLDFSAAVGNATGNPSLAKSEIVQLYNDFVANAAEQACREPSDDSEEALGRT